MLAETEQTSLQAQEREYGAYFVTRELMVVLADKRFPDKSINGLMKKALDCLDDHYFELEIIDEALPKFRREERGIFLSIPRRFADFPEMAKDDINNYQTIKGAVRELIGVLDQIVYERPDWVAGIQARFDKAIEKGLLNYIKEIRRV